MSNETSLETKVVTIQNFIVNNKYNETRSLIEQLYGEYSPLEEIENWNEDEKTLSWKIVELNNQACFEKKYSTE